MRLAGGYTGFPISSVLVAAEAISKSLAQPCSRAIFFITNSAMGLRQILPWQTKSIFVIAVPRISTLRLNIKKHPGFESGMLLFSRRKSMVCNYHFALRSAGHSTSLYLCNGLPAACIQVARKRQPSFASLWFANTLLHFSVRHSWRFLRRSPL